MKKIIGCFLLVMLVLLSIDKVAAAERPDFEKNGSINVYMRTTDSKLVTGGSIEIFKVANVQVTNLGNKYVYTSDFAGAGYSLDEEGIASLALELYNYTLDNNIHGDSYENKTGTVKLDNLSSGLYLINNKKAPKGYSRTMPFLVSMPFQIDGAWYYEVDASPKMGLLNQKTPLPTPTPKPEPGPGPEPDGEEKTDIKEEVHPVVEKNLVRFITSPVTGDISSNIFTIIICSILLCIVNVFAGVYLVRKRKTVIQGPDLVVDASESGNGKLEIGENCECRALIGKN